MVDLLDVNIKKAAEIILKAKHITAYTGAGISVESGIPAYRDEGGLWTKYDTKVLELNYFYDEPKECWKIIRQIFYDYFRDSKPNTAHKVLAKMEEKGMLKAIITQNIDNLHQEGGSKTVYEFHGNSKTMVCTKCGEKYKSEKINLDTLPPKCVICDGILKPDFIFFGEGIPQEAYQKSLKEADLADVFILIGTTGTVYPAASIPINAKQKGVKIIEVNPGVSEFTNSITDIHLKGKAGEIMGRLAGYLNIDI